MGNDQRDEAVIYAALGDSTGVGVGAKNGGYVARLFRRIKSLRPDSRLTNVCVSGAETEDVLRSQLKTALAARPNLITLGIGINDVGHGVQSRPSHATTKRSYATQAETTAPMSSRTPDISLAPSSPQLEGSSHSASPFQRTHQEVAPATTYRRRAYTATHDVINRSGFFSDDGFILRTKVTSVGRR